MIPKFQTFDMDEWEEKQHILIPDHNLFLVSPRFFTVFQGEKIVVCMG